MDAVDSFVIIVSSLLVTYHQNCLTLAIQNSGPDENVHECICLAVEWTG